MGCLLLLLAAVAAADFGFTVDRNISCPGQRRELSFTAPAGHLHQNSRVVVTSVGEPVDFAIKDAFKGRQTPVNGTLSLTMGKPGVYVVEYIAFPEDGSFALSQQHTVSVEVHERHCSSVVVAPETGCMYDRFVVQWVVPEATAAAHDWLGEESASASMLMHWFQK